MKNTTILLIVFIIFGTLFLGYLVGPSIVGGGEKPTASFQGYTPIATLGKSSATAGQSVWYSSEDVTLAISPTWYGEIYDNLAEYDTQKDGFITAVDPVYIHLELLVYRKGKAYLHMPIQAGGVRAINVVPDIQTGMLRVIFTDGSYRWLKPLKK